MTEIIDKPASISKTLMRGGLMRTFTFLANVIATLVVMPILIEGLGARNYGMWAMIGSIVAYYRLLDFGLASTNEKFMAQSVAEKNFERARSTFAASVTGFGVIGAVFALLTILISIMSPIFFSDPGDIYLFRFTFLILGLNFAITFPFYALEGALSANLLFEKVAAAKVVSILVRTVLIIALMSADHSLIALSFAIVFSSFIYRGLLIYFLKLGLPFLKLWPLTFSRDDISTLYHHGKYVLIGNVSSNAQFRLSNVIVASIFGLAAVTSFAIASRLSEYLHSVVRRLFSALLPVLSRVNATSSRGEFNYIFWNTFQINIVTTVMLFGMAIIFGENFIFLWLGPTFTQSYNLFVILAIGQALKQMQTSSLQALMARSLHKNANLYDLAESVTAVLLAVVLGQKFGLIGIALGIAVPMVANKVLLQPVVRCQDLGISVRRYYVTMFRYCLPTGLAFLPCWLVLQNLGMLNFLQFAAAVFTCMAVVTPIAVASLPKSVRKIIVGFVVPTYASHE